MSHRSDNLDYGWEQLRLALLEQRITLSVSGEDLTISGDTDLMAEIFDLWASHPTDFLKRPMDKVSMPEGFGDALGMDHQSIQLEPIYLSKSPKQECQCSYCKAIRGEQPSTPESE